MATNLHSVVAAVQSIFTLSIGLAFVPVKVASHVAAWLHLMYKCVIVVVVAVIVHLVANRQSITIKLESSMIISQSVPELHLM